VAAIDDDLDTPTALRIARQALRARIPPDERRWLVLDMDVVLGLDLHRSVPTRAGLDLDAADAATRDLPAAAEVLLAQRAAARTDRRWAEADRLRDELAAIGITVIDRSDGTSEARRSD
jgi:cysteinyl-tRNA synthetase